MIGQNRLRVISTLAIVLGVAALWWLPDAVPKFLSGSLALTGTALLFISAGD